MSERSFPRQKPTLGRRFKAWAESVEMSPAERLEARVGILERRIEALESDAKNNRS